MTRGTIAVLMLAARVLALIALLALAVFAPAEAACAPGTIPGECWPISDVTGPGVVEPMPRLWLPVVHGVTTTAVSGPSEPEEGE